MSLKSGTLCLAVQALAFAIAALALSSLSLAQDDNPMGLPPRTPPPPATVQQTPAEPEQPASGQQPAGPAITPIPNDDSRFVFKAQVQEVVLHATVVDETGRLVTNLDRGAFSIFQNDQPEAIMSFRKEDVPVAIGIVVDNSGSMRGQTGKGRRCGVEPDSRQQSAGRSLRRELQPNTLPGSGFHFGCESVANRAAPDFQPWEHGSV